MMKAPKKKAYTLAELVVGLEVTIKGDPNCLIHGVCTIQESLPGHITFLTNALYRKYLSDTKAAAVILTEEAASDSSVNAVISKNPYYTYAKIAEFFATEQENSAGIHKTAFIDKHAEIDATASIGPQCVIGQNTKIGPHVVIGAGTIIGRDCEIDAETIVDANVTIYDRVKIGQFSRIMSGAVIGSDGFGFANQKGSWYKVPQLGGVEIGNFVDIGANTTIDRGAIHNTVIEDGVKLDNLIQVGHNVRIGANTIIAGCVAIAGSTTIGKYCMIGGATCFAGHLNICDNVVITGMTSVSKSIREPGIYSSGVVGVVTNQEFRKNNARFHRLDVLFERVKTLESAIKMMTERKET